jgi:hypothetical protein
MSKVLPSDYFAAQDRLCEWFEDLKRVVGCGENADLGAVLRKAEARERKIEAYEVQQAIVARHYNYESWGYIVRAAMNGSEEEVIVVETPKECLEVPRDWCYGEGKPDYSKAKKQLPTTQKLLRKGLLFIEERRPEEGDEWAEETRQNLIKAFVESGSPMEVEKEVWRFINGVDEEGDPSGTWVLIADEAAAVLERSADLPKTAVEELIAYAYETEVEMTKKGLASIEESEFRSKRFFDYLLTACLHKQSRASNDEVTKTSSLVGRAFSYWGCYVEESANDPLRPEKKRRVYDPNISMEQIEAACREVFRLDEEANEQLSHEGIAEAVRAAVKSLEPAKALATTEKN